MNPHDKPQREPASRQGLHRRDAYAEIIISDDGMEARAVLHPPVDGGEPLTPDYFDHLFNQSKVIAGIQWDGLHEAILKCNTETRSPIEMVIARGQPAVSAIPAHIRILEKFLKPQQAAVEEGRVDFRRQRNYLLVKAGEVLAEDVPGRSGEAGWTVAGTEIPSGEAAMTLYQPGANLRHEGGRWISGTAGHFVLRGEVFSVDNVLEVQGDVSYESGNIEYPGDVVIHGRIHDGFKIAAAGSVTCHDTVDASEIYCKGDLTAAAGIIGRGTGVVRVSGVVRAKFADNCRIEALKTVEIQGGVFGAAIYTLQDFNAGDKGRLVGGEVKALGSIVVGQLGKSAGTRTVVCAGVNFVAERRLEQASRKLRDLSPRRRGLEEALKTGPTRELEEERDRLAVALRTINAEIEEILPRLYAREAVTVTVHGTVYPGVVIAIGSASLEVLDEKRRLVFTLDKAQGKIREESLSAQPTPRGSSGTKDQLKGRRSP